MTDYPWDDAPWSRRTERKVFADTGQGHAPDVQIRATVRGGRYGTKILSVETLDCTTGKMHVAEQHLTADEYAVGVMPTILDYFKRTVLNQLATGGKQ